MSNEIPETQYDRLLYALGLEQSGEYYRTFFTQASDMLEVRMSQLSDCIRRGKIVTGPVLEAARAKGINPNFIKNGTEPVYLEGFAAINGKKNEYRIGKNNNSFCRDRRMVPLCLQGRQWAILQDRRA